MAIYAPFIFDIILNGSLRLLLTLINPRRFLTHLGFRISGIIPLPPHSHFSYYVSQLVDCKYCQRVATSTAISFTGASTSGMHQKKHGIQCQCQLLSRVHLFAMPQTVAHQAPQSMEFSRQEYWSGLPFPSPGDLLDNKK